MYLCCYVYSLCYVIWSLLFRYFGHMGSKSIYTLFRMLINYILNLCFEIIKAVSLFRIIINFNLLLTRIYICPYYCINKSVKQFKTINLKK